MRPALWRGHNKGLISNHIKPSSRIHVHITMKLPETGLSVVLGKNKPFAAATVMNQVVAWLHTHAVIQNLGLVWVGLFLCVGALRLQFTFDRYTPSFAQWLSHFSFSHIGSLFIMTALSLIYLQYAFFLTDLSVQCYFSHFQILFVLF